MLASKHSLRWIRASLAVILACLFSVLSVAPIAAAVFDSAPGGMACCKTKGACCCRKHGHRNSGSGPAFQSACGGDCAGAALGGISAMGSAVIRLEFFTPAVQTAVEARLHARLASSRIGTHNLRQRPPPQAPIV
jgi:hypothetical protein